MKQNGRFMSIKWLAVGMMAVVLPLSGQALESKEELPKRTTGEALYIIGSTLMKDYTDAVMDRLMKNAKLPPAIIANKGSTRGIEAFCMGVGIETPDIVAVSRRIRSTELDACRAHGVTDIVEIQVGYEATGLVSRRDDKDYPLTLVSLYRAIAAELPRDVNDFIPNRYSRWHEVDPTLPDTEIRLAIPVPSLGGRAFLEDRILQGACRNILEIKTIFGAENRVKQCITLRNDGRITELDTPYDKNIVRTLNTSPPGTLAVIPLRFATEHKDALKVQPLDGIVPSHETVSNHQYEFTRPLYFLVKKAHIKNYWGEGMVSGLREFITEITRESTIGPEGYLVKLGVFPMEEERRSQIRETSLRLGTIER
jgi:phosphate transport system substrate-binding protein